MTAPPALQRVQFIDALCQRWGCRPSELLQEDAGLVLGMLTVLGLGDGASDDLGGVQDGNSRQEADSGHPGALQGDMERMLAAQSRGI